MKKWVMASVGAVFIFALCFNLHAQTSAANLLSPPGTMSQTLPQPTPYQVINRDASQNIWERTTYEKAPNGTIVPKKHHYTELATGLNYKKNGQWVESKEEIDILPDGTAAATNGQHQVYFPSDIYNGVIQMVTPDGKHLKSHPIGLSYDDGNNTVMIATLTNSVGELVSSNQVIYPDAFVGFKADLRYTYTKAGFEQDVIIREQPPAPEDFNLDPQNTRLQLMTEFFNPPQPSITADQLPEQEGMALNDDNLDFGKMKMIQGRAFLLGANNQDEEALVGKEWMNVSGRQILIEEVPVMALAGDLLQLPLPTASTKINSPQRVASAKRLLPPQHLAKAGNKEMFIAKAFQPADGLVLDYNTINSSLTNYTFQGDTTYYISSSVDLYGTTVIEGGTVVKYHDTFNRFHGPVICQTGPYRPATFTATDDNTVGETINGSTGNPSGTYAFLGLELYTNVDLEYLHIKYAVMGVYFYGGTWSTLRHSQLINCNQSFVTGVPAEIENVLIVQNSSQSAITLTGSGSASLIAENLTVDGSSATSLSVGYGALSITNSLFIGMSSMGSFTGAYNYTNSSAAGVFQTVGAGSHYLATNSICRNAGTTNIDPVLLADIRTKTTYPPIVYSNITFSTNLTLSPQAPRDTNSAPDLGYHYDPIDYLVACTFSNATLTITNGAALAYINGAGLSFQGNGQLISRGTVQRRNYLIHYSLVQEQSVSLGSGNPNIFSPWGDMNGTVDLDFTTLVFPQRGVNVNSVWFDADMFMRNCEVFGSGTYLNPEPNGHTVVWENNLLEYVQVTEVSGSGNYTIRNNLFTSRGASGYGLGFMDEFDGTWIFTDNIFDGCSGSGMMVGGRYNAYVNGATGATENDIVLPTFTWVTGPLGDYYQPTNSPLLNMGSTTADQVGLYHFTTQTNQVEETNSVVDIGYHYVATDAYGNPLETLWFGIPDYLADTNGELAAWEMNYFGQLGFDPNDFDANGNTLLYDYQNDIVPNDTQKIPILLSTISVTDPVDIKFVAPSNLYVLSGSTATITEFNTNGNTIRSLSSLGSNPTGFDVDAAGNVYVAVSGNNQVWKFNPTTSSFIADTNFGFNGFIGDTNGASGYDTNQFNAPYDVAVSPDGGTISISDSGNDRIQQFSTNGTFTAFFGSSGGDVGQFSMPEGLAYDSVGYLYIADSGNNRIVLVQGSTILGASGTSGTAFDQFNSPANVSVNDRGIYVADFGNNRVQTFNPIVPHTSPTPFMLRSVLATNFNQPAAVAAVDNLTNEMFYVADTGNNRVLLYGYAAEDPTPAWSSMTNRIAAGDLSGAVSRFSSVSTNQYQQAFSAIGTNDLSSAISQIGTLTPVSIGNDAAEYYFTNTIDGQTITFPIEFVKENGVWKILEF